MAVEVRRLRIVRLKLDLELWRAERMEGPMLDAAWGSC